MLAISSYNDKNINGNKLIEKLNDTFDWNIDLDNGLIGDKINKHIENSFKKMGIAFLRPILGCLELGFIGYSFYECIKIMFFKNKANNNGAKPLDKVIFAYFIFFILRILDTLLKIKGLKIGS